MSAQDILKSYQAIQQKIQETTKSAVVKMPVLEEETYSFKELQPQIFSSIEEVHNLLTQFNPKEGWLGFQSKNEYFRKGNFSIDSNNGVLMNAEMINAEKTSLQLRYDGRGQWIIVQYKYMEGSDYIADKVKHLATDDSLSHLNYLRFWQLGSMGIEPFAACFIGFGE